MPHLTCFLVLPMLLVLAASPAMAAENNNDDVARIISVTGEGEATAPPDMATVTTGVETQAETAGAALDKNNRVMQKLLAVLEKQGVAKKDVQTVNFSVRPIYDRDEDGRREPKVIAYRVENQVQVHVRKLDSLGKILDALVAAGSNRISGISFGIDDPSKILAEARASAIHNAKARAKTYAKAAGVAVGRVLQISEQTSNPPQPMRFGVATASLRAGTVPIATGEQEYHVTVNVIYELK